MILQSGCYFKILEKDRSITKIVAEIPEKDWSVNKIGRKLEIFE